MTQVASVPAICRVIEPQVEALIAASGIDFRIGGNRPFTVLPRTTFRCGNRLPISN